MTSLISLSVLRFAVMNGDIDCLQQFVFVRLLVKKVTENLNEQF